MPCPASSASSGCMVGQSVGKRPERIDRYQLPSWESSEAGAVSRLRSRDLAHWRMRSSLSRKLTLPGAVMGRPSGHCPLRAARPRHESCARSGSRLGLGRGCRLGRRMVGSAVDAGRKMGRGLACRRHGLQTRPGPVRNLSGRPTGVRGGSRPGGGPARRYFDPRLPSSLSSPHRNTSRSSRGLRSRRSRRPGGNDGGSGVRPFVGATDQVVARSVGAHPAGRIARVSGSVGRGMS